MSNHFNIQRVHLSLRECLCSCNMGVIILTKLQTEMLSKLKKAYVILVYGGKQTSILRNGCKDDQILKVAI